MLEEFVATLEPLLAVADETAPQEVANDVGTLSRLSREALTTGDDSLFESEEFTDADANVDDYMLANCGFEQVEVTGERFGIACFIPVGSTPDAVESGEEVEGPPHAIAEGMFAELTVE